MTKGLERLDDTLRPAIMSGMLSDMLTASVAKYSRALVVNQYFNGHPDLVLKGEHAGNAVKAGDKGIEDRPHARPEARSIRTARASSGCACLSMRWTARPSRRANGVR